MDKQIMDTVVRFEMRTRQLILQHKQLQDELARTRALLAQGEEQIKGLQTENQQLREQYAHLKMAKYIDMADYDNRVSRTRINKMLRDIEKCLAMLKMEQ